MSFRSGRSRRLPPPRTARPARRLLASLAFLAALTLAGPRLQPSTAASPTTGRRLILLGLDGADWLAIDPMVEAGKLPAFARLKAGGRTGIMLSTPPLLSPILWTTIATGRRPEDHRVLDFMVDLPTGGQAPIAATDRRVEALWNVFSASGRSVGVVGWWATWPAENVRGTIVSDRVAPQLIRPDAGPDDKAIAPPSAARTLAPLLVRATELTREDLSAYRPVTPEEFQAAHAALRTPGSRFYRNPLAHLAAIVASTRTLAKMAEAILSAGQPDLLLVYLEEIDSISHRFVRDARRGPGAIEQAYRDADALLARLAARSAPDTWIVVCSDHGFYAASAGIVGDPTDLTGPATAWHRPYGIVAAAEARTLAGGAGAGAPRPSRETAPVGTVTPLDLAPTLLHAAGLPVSLEMPGRVVAALVPEDSASRAVARVPTFEPVRRPETPTLVRAVDPELRDRLQALGYIGADTTSLARQNLGEILFRKGDHAGAERELREVVEAQPQNVTALLWLAKAVRAQGRPQSSLALYERTLKLPGDNGDALIEAIDLAATSGLKDDARRILAGFQATGRTRAEAAVAQAIVAEMDGHRDLAERALRSALAADTTCLPALSRLLDLLIPRHRAGEALPLFVRAAEAAPASPRHQALLGAALLAAGNAAAAEGRFHRALRLAPDGATLQIDLARAQLAQGKAEAALATLGPVPPSVERSILLGAAHARRGDWMEAAKQYRVALDQGPATPELLNGLAWAEIQLDRKAEAAALLTRSLSLDRNQPDISRLLAEIGRPPAP